MRGEFELQLRDIEAGCLARHHRLFKTALVNLQKERKIGWWKEFDRNSQAWTYRGAHYIIQFGGYQIDFALIKSHSNAQRHAKEYPLVKHTTLSSKSKSGKERNPCKLSELVMDRITRYIMERS